jgi:hypothetical protein
MTNRIHGRLAAATLFGLFALVAPRANAQKAGPDSTASATPKATACTITLSTPSSVQVAASPVVLQATISGAIGDSISASFPTESKLSAVGVKAGSTPNALMLTLNTSQAVPGEWPIALKGTNGECTGKIKVDQPKH